MPLKKKKKKKLLMIKKAVIIQSYNYADIFCLIILFFEIFDKIVLFDKYLGK
jgi:hypothetical protein